ncbi:hypothetical protein AVEN_142681-1 [Araneus ventricosus]|uniref:Uncharacterized protein n=1 Tax=Araneus ventricosus TaxID=182803 RepID=A0A4Y2U3H3_ARAVE|nr:hypothetical protein AVEN_142681-1 [Araneus ventricosus]
MWIAIHPVPEILFVHFTTDIKICLFLKKGWNKQNQEHSRVCSVPIQRTLPYGQDHPLSDVATSTVCMVPLSGGLARLPACLMANGPLTYKPIWAPKIRLLAIAASTCLDLPSSVAVFGLSCIGDGTCPFEFHDKFCHGVMGYLRSVSCIESTRYMTGGTPLSQPNNANSFFLR